MIYLRDYSSNRLQGDIARDTGALSEASNDQRKRFERERQHRCRERKRSKFETPKQSTYSEDSDLSAAATLFRSSFEVDESGKIQLDALKIILHENNFSTAEKESARNEVLKKAKMNRKVTEGYCSRSMHPLNAALP